MMSGRMALSVAAVSIRVSPFFTEEDATDMFITSAPSRLPAISKEDWGRVEGSENRLVWGRARAARLGRRGGAEPLAGDLEGGLGAGRGLEEQVDLGAAAQRRLLLLDLP